MLVITRKQNEKIRIGDDITIVIKKTEGSTVFIGVECPKEKKVNHVARKEDFQIKSLPHKPFSYYPK